jgi:hypothetical protein
MRIGYVENVTHRIARDALGGGVDGAEEERRRLEDLQSRAQVSRRGTLPHLMEEEARLVRAVSGKLHHIHSWGVAKR